MDVNLERTITAELALPQGNQIPASVSLVETSMVIASWKVDC